MRDHSLPGLPAVQQKAGRFQNKVSRPVGMQIQHHLMRYTRRDTGDRAGKAGLQTAMQMTTQYPFNLPMAGDNRFQSLRIT